MVGPFKGINTRITEIKKYIRYNIVISRGLSLIKNPIGTNLNFLGIEKKLFFPVMSIDIRVTLSLLQQCHICWPYLASLTIVNGPS